MLLEVEGMKAADLYGDGFSSISELSKWAAHWGISLLESRGQARAIEESRREVEDRIEQQMKAYIGAFFRSKMNGHA